MKYKTGMVLLFGLLMSITAFGNPDHTYITLSPKGCEQVAEIVVKRVAGVPVDLTKMEEDAVTVAEAILEMNSDLNQFPPQVLHQVLLESCYSARGKTDVAPRTKT